MMIKSEEKKEQQIAIAEMEVNLKNAINDLIEECDNQPTIVSQHVSMIITHLAKIAAALRIKKQQRVKDF